MPEAAGPNSRLVNPDCSEEIATGISDILSNELLRKEMIHKEKDMETTEVAKLNELNEADLFHKAVQHAVQTAKGKGKGQKDPKGKGKATGNAPVALAKYPTLCKFYKQGNCTFW